MTSHGGSRHVHRLAAPKKLPILRRTAHYVIKTMPGPHPAKSSIPLLVALRDLLGVTKNMKESKKILNERKVFVDGKVRTSPKFPLGFMDVLSFPSVEKYYRTLFGVDGKVKLKEISRKEADVKLCKILNKVKIKGGKTQLNLHDGRNIIVDEDVYKTGDSLLISVPSQEIKKHLKKERGVLVFITDGKHIGQTATIVDFHPMPGSYPDRVVLKAEDGTTFETLNKYIFVIGKEKPEIDL